MYKVIIYEPEEVCLGTIVLLVGRDGKAIDMMRYYREFSELNQTRIIAVEPFEEWYPAPNGSNDQQEAICGLKLTIPDFDTFLKKIQSEFKIDRNQIALVGFSAGAVVAIQLAAHSENPFAAVVSHNGAILTPENMIPAKHKIPILLIHSKDDVCFSWDERYLPMKIALFNQGYVVKVLEKEDGDHTMSVDDIAASANFLADIFQYPQEWTHSSQYMEL